MSIYNITDGDDVKCIGSDHCDQEDCTHYGRHRARRHYDMAHDCRLVSWCSAINGWVRDKQDWAWLQDDKPDPNVAFKRRKSR